jgi:hypothetical protein
MFSLGELRADAALSTQRRRWFVLAVAVLVAVPATAGWASSQAQGGVLAAKCAKVKVRATPKINAQTAPNETIKSRVTNCSSAKETVILTQTIAGPSATAAAMAKQWMITLSPGKTVVKTRLFPYACCGTYNVTDRVLTKSGRQLARAETSFTFA